MFLQTARHCDTRRSSASGLTRQTKCHWRHARCSATTKKENNPCCNKRKSCTTPRVSHSTKRRQRAVIPPAAASAPAVPTKNTKTVASTDNREAGAPTSSLNYDHVNLTALKSPFFLSFFYVHNLFYIFMI